ncbi:MAG: 50S ribosomal protein L23 [Ardenticatenaceae bacterium]
MHLYEVIRRPIVTEKSMALRDEGQYTFEVNKKANKRQIKEAVEKIFDVEVVNVRTIIIKGKNKRWGRTRYQTSSIKKAMVTLAEGDSITYFEGV